MMTASVLRSDQLGLRFASSSRPLTRVFTRRGLRAAR